MSLERIVDTQIKRASGDLVGNIASNFYEYHFNWGPGYTWACDVDIGREEVLRFVPIDPAAKNDVFRFGQPGTPVVLRRVSKDRYVIIGLSPRKLSLTQITYVCFDEYVAEIQKQEYVGYVYRKLTYGELATCGGYGNVPYGAVGKFTHDGEFVELR